MKATEIPLNYIAKAEGDYDEVRHLILSQDCCHNVIIEGPPGIGKTTLARDVSRIRGFDIVPMDISNTSGEYEIGLRQGLGVDPASGQTMEVTMDSPYTMAMKKGSPFLFNEISELSEPMQDFLHGSLDEARTLQTTHGKIHAKEGFMVMGTYNRLDDYVSSISAGSGYGAFKPAFARRFTGLSLEFLPQEQEDLILKLRFKKHFSAENTKARYLIVKRGFTREEAPIPVILTNNNWVTLQGKPVTSSEIFTYNALQVKKNMREIPLKNKDDFFIALSHYAEQLRYFRQKGSLTIQSAFLLNTESEQNKATILFQYPIVSHRIYAIETFVAAINSGYSFSSAVYFAVYVFIGSLQVGYEHEAYLNKDKHVEVKDFLIKVARHFGLLPLPHPSVGL